eukprot:3698751-Ditylum_brightwellii.AAC.1
MSFAATYAIAPDMVGICILLGQNSHNHECLLHSLVPTLLCINGGLNVKLSQFNMHPLHNAEGASHYQYGVPYK